jgi:hypothetical protein
VMQTKTAGGMQTMEQALADLALRGVVNVDDALSRSSRPEQLAGILERSGMDVSAALAKLDAPKAPPQHAAPSMAPATPPPTIEQQPAPALRMAGS